MIRRSTSSSVECSSDLFAKPRSLRKEWCGFMGDVFFHHFYRRGNGCFFVAFLLTNVDVPTVKCKSVFEYWCQWLGMIWGAGSNWNSIEIDTSIHMPFLHDIWMIRKRKKTLATDEMDGGFYAFSWLLQWKEWFQFIQFQLPGPTALPGKLISWSFQVHQSSSLWICSVLVNPVAKSIFSRFCKATSVLYRNVGNIYK